jgi:ribosome-associated protein
MQTKDLQKIAVKALDDLQAIDTTIIDVRTLTTITDLMIICTGRSTRHIKSIADNLVAQAKNHQVSYLHIEGDENSEWVLVDMGDLVVHIMLESTRSFYNLEALWEPLSELKTQEVR